MKIYSVKYKESRKYKDIKEGFVCANNRDSPKSITKSKYATTLKHAKNISKFHSVSITK